MYFLDGNVIQLGKFATFGVHNLAWHSCLLYALGLVLIIQDLLYYYLAIALSQPTVILVNHWKWAKLQ